MAYKNILLDDGKGTYYSFEGIVKSDDFVHLVSNNLQSNFERFLSLENAIIDFSNLDKILLNEAFLNNMINFCKDLSKVNSTLVVASIIDSIDSEEFTQKMISKFVETKWILKSFKTYESALQWARSIKEG